MLLHRVARQADDLDAGPGEVARQPGEVLRFAGTARRVVLGIEVEHQWLARRRQVELAPVAEPGLQRRNLVALVQHRPFPFTAAQRSAILCRAASTAASNAGQSSNP